MMKSYRTISLIVISILITIPLMSQEDRYTKTSIEVSCDPITGLCTIPDFDAPSEIISWKVGEELIYIGDPMCSWCWGISPELNALEQYATSEGIPFKILMGGLRPGGGEEWNDEFKGFLRHHWEEVNKRSGQPFGFDLFELADFDYDTEPACRATVTARTLAPAKALTFYELVQHHFYVRSEDPKEVAFYKPICEQLSIDFDHFAKLFVSDEMKLATAEDFAQSRQWGVRAFPSVVYRKDDQLYIIAQGYDSYHALRDRVAEIGSSQ